MNPDYDKQTNPRWPNMLDGPTARSRRLAGMYRALLNTAAPDLCRQADDTARAYGETWMLEREDLLDPTRALTTAEAAELVNVTAKTIRTWATLDHPEQPGEKLLPRFKKRGREMTYLTQHVLAAAAAVQRNRIARGRI